MVVLASGVKEDLDMAINAGIHIGKWGIKTNASMETNIKDIYAAGDCIETVSLIDHRPTMMQLSFAAFRQGMVAGTNAAGGVLNIVSEQNGGTLHGLAQGEGGNLGLGRVRGRSGR